MTCRWNKFQKNSILPLLLKVSKKNYVWLLFISPSPSLKMMENAFYFILKAPFFLKIFKFLSWLFGNVKKTACIKNIMLISKLMTSQPGWQTITMHILPNISRSKGNQTIKFGQLVDYNKQNVFLQKSCKTWGRETSFRPVFVF